MKKFIFVSLVALMLTLSTSTVFASTTPRTAQFTKPEAEWILFPICFPRGEDLWVCIPSL